MAAYTLSQRAQSDIREIRDYLAVAPLASRDKVIANLMYGFQQAADFPMGGRSEPRAIDPYRPVRSVLVYPYRVFYYPDVRPVEIISIVHGSRDPDRLLRGR